MRSRGLSFVFLALLASASTACLAGDPGAAPDDESVGEGADRIVGGVRAVSYAEAVLIDMKMGGKVRSACSGSLIAAQVVLTAGHCVHGFDGWSVTAPYAEGQTAEGSSGVTYDWKGDSKYVDPSRHDVGLVFLDEPIELASYPSLHGSPLARGSTVVNVGRIDDGVFSATDLFVSKPISVQPAAAMGFPHDYIAAEVIQSGDSGGPDFIPGTHTIVAVNSGAGGGTEVLARIDLVLPWIQTQMAARGF